MLQFTSIAQDDLVEIHSYIAERNPENAALFINVLLDACTLIATQPGAGRARDELGAVSPAMFAGTTLFITGLKTRMLS